MKYFKKPKRYSVSRAAARYKLEMECRVWRHNSKSRNVGRHLVASGHLKRFISGAESRLPLSAIVDYPTVIIEKEKRTPEEIDRIHDLIRRMRKWAKSRGYL